MSILPSQPATVASVLGCDVEIILGKQRIKHITALSTSIWDLPGPVTSLTSQISFLLLWNWGLPGPPFAIPAELAPGAACCLPGVPRGAQRENTDSRYLGRAEFHIYIHKTIHALISKGHSPLIFSSPLTPCAGISHHHTPMKCSCQKGKIPHKNSLDPQSTVFLSYLKEVKLIFITAKMAGENLYPNA